MILSSLKSLAIRHCPKLKDLCLGILHLSSLRSFEIDKCEELGEMINDEDDDNAIMWKALDGSLHKLTLSQFCDSLTIIPEWIGNL